MDVTILIKTYERPRCLRRLLRSIRRQGIDCAVLVADDSHEPCRDAVLAEFGDLVTEYVVLPPGSGLSAGRNALLERVETPYFVLCDDDFVFDRRSDVEAWVRMIREADLDILGGVLYRLPTGAGAILRTAARLAVGRRWWQLVAFAGSCFQGELYTFEGRYHRAGPVVICSSIEYKDPWTPCDYTFNFFVARRDVVLERMGGWDERLRMGEHEDFFYRAKQLGVKVGTTHRVGARHRAEWSEGYRSERAARVARFKQLFLRKHDLVAFFPHPADRSENIIDAERIADA